MLALTADRLTALMLGRLKMTIEEAKDWYSAVGEHVFKRPRKRVRGVIKYVAPRLSGRYMDEVLKRATVFPKQAKEGVDGGSSWWQRTDRTLDDKAKHIRMGETSPDVARTYARSGPRLQQDTDLDTDS